jgi:hypothetical protein
MMAESVAVHDAVFLGLHDWTAIPAMFLSIAVSILLLVLLDTRLAHRIARVTPPPAAWVAAAALFLSEWLLGAMAGSMLVALRCSLAGLRQRAGIAGTDCPDRHMPDRQIVSLANCKA